jgi:carbamoyl-phosphate synthase large subunit
LTTPGTQACKALREEGYEVVLINSNPATIMTDPETADRTYIEPLTPEIVERVIERSAPTPCCPPWAARRPEHWRWPWPRRVLERYGVELIGAKLEAIEMAEDRKLCSRGHGADRGGCAPQGGGANMEEARRAPADRQLSGHHPPLLHPGRHRRRHRLQPEEFETEIGRAGLEPARCPRGLIEQSVIGWKEYELEVMRDLADNVVIICSIENLDPMGVHTGDSITVAPAQTLTDKEYQRLRDASIKIIREIGVETGGSNIQFAVNPDTGRTLVIEMNPRVSRSSALASKATGFPIAKIAAKLAVGYTLDELPNDITRETPASFEPTIDYVVTKIPRFAFEKFPGPTTP